MLDADRERIETVNEIREFLDREIITASWAASSQAVHGDIEHSLTDDEVLELAKNLKGGVPTGYSSIRRCQRS